MPNLLIDAGPGCGKTQTAIWLYSYIRATNLDAWMKQHKQVTQEQIDIFEWCRKNLPPECKEFCCYIAYNKDIAADTAKKIHVEAESKTSNGWGAKILNAKFGFLAPKDNRGQMILEKTILKKPLNSLNNSEKFKWLGELRYIEKMKNELLPNNMETLEYLFGKYDNLRAFRPHEDMILMIQQLMVAMKTVNREYGIEFIDQIWLSLFVLKEPRYPFGVVDECQDVSASQLELAKRLCKHLVFVGDGNQAINAWNGADAEAFNKIRTICDAELPLKTSFRLPPNRCNRLNQIRPAAKLKPLPERKDGKEMRMTLPEFVDYVKEGGEEKYKNFMAVCRYNAPLLKVCLAFMRQNVPCYVLGSTHINSLITMVKNRKATSIEDLKLKLKAWGNQMTANCEDYVADQIRDKINCVFTVLPQCNEVSDVETELKKFLVPHKRANFIKACTIHKSKGLESHTTAILFPPVRHPKAKTKEQIEQEINLEFVAESRMMEDVIWVTE